MDRGNCDLGQPEPHEGKTGRRPGQSRDSSGYQPGRPGSCKVGCEGVQRVGLVVTQ